MTPIPEGESRWRGQDGKVYDTFADAVVLGGMRAEALDPDGWQKPRDLRDEALEDMRQQLAAARASESRAWERVKLLEARLDDIREALVKR